LLITALITVVARSIGKARPLAELLLCPVGVVLTEVLVGVTRPGSVARKVIVHHVRVGRICALGACWRGRRRRRTAHDVAVVSRSILEGHRSQARSLVTIHWFRSSVHSVHAVGRSVAQHSSPSYPDPFSKHDR